MLINIIILVTVLEIQYLIRYLLFLLIQLFLMNKLSVNLIQLWLVFGIFSSSLIASMIYFGIMSLLGIFQSPKILLITYILLGVVYCWNQTIFQSVKFQLAKIANNNYNQYEYIVASEFPIALGRIIGLSISLITCSLFSLNNAYRFLIIFNGTLWLIDHFIINKKVQWLEKEKL